MQPVTDREMHLLKNIGGTRMRRSFYHYLMTLKGPKIADVETKFANDVGDDIQFPKQSENYDQISSYLEMNAYYVPSMDIFDDIWEKYLENND